VIPILVVAAAVAQAAAPPPACDRSPLVVRHADVWTPAGIQKDRDVVVRDGRVVEIGPAATRDPAGVRTLDAAGHTLLPGLVDAHLHFVVPGGLPPGSAPGREAAVAGRQLLQAGVTAGRLHLASIESAADLKARGANDCEAVPRLQAGGPGFSGAAQRDYPNFWGVTSAADAAAKVARVADAGLDWIALHDAERFEPAVLDAIVSAARGRGLRLMGAGTSAAQIEAVLRAQPDTLDYFLRDEPAAYPAPLLIAIRRHPTVILAPTFGIQHRVARYAAQPAQLDDPANYPFLEPAERVFVTEAARGALAKEAAGRDVPGFQRKAAQLRALGLPLAIASDVGSPLHFQAGGIWWELEGWRALGFSHREALTAATEGAARVLGAADAGRLAAGSRADFVLYRGGVENGPFDAGRVIAVAKGGVLFVRGGTWTGP
jgi:imidazolonepropionase-like amidohydrolase